MSKLYLCGCIFFVLLQLQAYPCFAQEYHGQTHGQMHGEKPQFSNPAVGWNQVASMVTQKLGPQMQTRVMSMMHIAMYDAVAGFESNYPMFVMEKVTPATGDAPMAALHAAAFNVLHEVLPNEHAKSIAKAQYEAQLSGIRDGQDKNFGLEFGRRVADALLATRKDDGAKAALEEPCEDGLRAGQWRRTGTGEPLAPGWGRVRPWTLENLDAYDAYAPPALESSEYADAYREVHALGAKGSTTRSEDQTASAEFWKFHVPMIWNALARDIANRENLSLVESVRLFAMLDTAMAEASIVGWKLKYGHKFWRPETAIPLGDTDGNEMTTADAGWVPLLPSPPFPEYVSGHSITSGAAASILAHFMKSDDYEFELAVMDGKLKRRFSSFRAAAEEAGLSRIYGGIHFGFSNRDGLAIGKLLGDRVAEAFARPL